MRLSNYLTEKDHETGEWEVMMVDKTLTWKKTGKKREYSFVVRAKDQKQAKEKAEQQKPTAKFVSAKVMS